MSQDDALLEVQVAEVLDQPHHMPFPHHKFEYIEAIESVGCEFRMLGRTAHSAVSLPFTPREFVETYRANLRGGIEQFTWEAKCLFPGGPGQFPPPFETILMRLATRWASDIFFRGRLTWLLADYYFALMGTSAAREHLDASSH